MNVLRPALLAAAALLCLLFLVGYAQAVLPLFDVREPMNFDVFDSADVAFLRFWDHERRIFGPLTLQLFKVADDPTGHATVIYRFHSCYLALPATGILIYAICKLGAQLRRAALNRTSSLEARKLLTGK